MPKALNLAFQGTLISWTAHRVLWLGRPHLVIRFSRSSAREYYMKKTIESVYEKYRCPQYLVDIYIYNMIHIHIRINTYIYVHIYSLIYLFGLMVWTCLEYVFCVFPIAVLDAHVPRLEWRSSPWHRPIFRHMAETWWWYDGDISDLIRYINDGKWW